MGTPIRPSSASRATRSSGKRFSRSSSSATGATSDSANERTVSRIATCSSPRSKSMALDLSDPLCTISPPWMRFLRAVDDRSRSSTGRPELSTVPATELAAGVQRVLADQIASGRLRPNERINQERVASELGVSRTPVREALRWLERDGLVRLEARRGAFVAAFDAGDIDDIYELREVLEPRAVRRA